MVKFVEVNPQDIEFSRQGHRGRVSYPILKSFLEIDKLCVMLDRTGVQQNFQALYSMLRAYAINHKMPIKIFSSDGEIYLLRLDMDEEGLVDADWKPEDTATDGGKKVESHMSPVLVTLEEVAKRAEEEAGSSTK